MKIVIASLKIISQIKKYELAMKFQNLFPFDQLVARGLILVVKFHEFEQPINIYIYIFKIAYDKFLVWLKDMNLIYKQITILSTTTLFQFIVQFPHPNK